MIRRNFLTGILAAGCAPAIVRAESLMRIWVPPTISEVAFRGSDVLRIENLQFGKESSYFDGHGDFIADWHMTPDGRIRSFDIRSAV